MCKKKKKPGIKAKAPFFWRTDCSCCQSSSRRVPSWLYRFRRQLEENAWHPHQMDEHSLGRTEVVPSITTDIRKMQNLHQTSTDDPRPSRPPTTTTATTSQPWIYLLYLNYQQCLQMHSVPVYFSNCKLAAHSFHFLNHLVGVWEEGQAISVQQLSHRNSVHHRAAVNCMSSNGLFCSSHLAAVNLS